MRLQQYPIQVSGKTLTDFLNNNENSQHPLGVLIEKETKEGSFTLKSNLFQECFHSLTGALAETKEKFIDPAELNKFRPGDPIRVLDVCFGLGYNTAYLLEALKNATLILDWWGLELDSRPLDIALKTLKFRKNWTNPILKKLEEVRDKNGWNYKTSKGKLLLGDARKKVNEIPKDFNFNIIMLDPFSPKKCPELWTEEFLGKISNRLAPGGRILTYSSAAAIRATLRRSGLTLRSLGDRSKSNKRWSNGTLAIKSLNTAQELQELLPGNSLSLMEEEHMQTRASIPYRDPLGCDNSEEILTRRESEQMASQLESTSSWQKRWVERTRDEKSSSL